MSAKHIAQNKPSQSQAGLTGADMSNGIGESRSVWLTAREAARYCGNRSVNAFYMWRRAKGLVPNGRGFYARRDLDKAMAIPRKRHAMSPCSLANLKHRTLERQSSSRRG